MSREIRIPNADIYERDAPGYVDFLTKLIDSRQDAHTFISVVDTSGLLNGVNDGISFLLNEVHIENEPSHSILKARNLLGVYLSGESSIYHLAVLDPYLARDRDVGIKESRNHEYKGATGCNIFRGSFIRAEYLRYDGSGDIFDFPLKDFKDVREVGK